jgi:hypothetical protein
MYVDFVEYYVSAVIGLRHFEKQKCNKTYSSYVTISDEAFAILSIENNWDRWMAMAKAQAWKTSPVPTKWTVTRDKTSTPAKRGNAILGQENQPQARRYRGWSAQGINRYNQLFDQIRTKREAPSFAHFEDKLLLHFQKQAESSSKKIKKQRREPPPLPMPKHELWGQQDTIITNSVTRETEKDTNNNSDTSIDDDGDDGLDQLPNYG